MSVCIKDNIQNMNLVIGCTRRLFLLLCPK